MDTRLQHLAPTELILPPRLTPHTQRAVTAYAAAGSYVRRSARSGGGGGYRSAPSGTPGWRYSSGADGAGGSGGSGGGGGGGAGEAAVGVDYLRTERLADGAVGSLASAVDKIKVRPSLFLLASVRPQMFALNCSPSTVRPQLFALN